MRNASIAALGAVAQAGNGVVPFKPIKYTILQEYKLTQASQVVKGSGQAGVITTDTTDVPGGQDSQVHLTKHSYNPGTGYGIALPTPFDFTNGFFRVHMRCENYAYTRGGWTWYFATSAADYAAGNYYYARVGSGAQPNWFPPGTYCWDSIHPAMFSKVGNPSGGIASVGYIRLSVSDVTTSQTCYFDLARLQVIQQNSTKAKVVIWHDDGTADGGAPIHDKLLAKGWAASEAAMFENVNLGGSGNYTTASLNTYRSQGWTFNSHSTTSPEHNPVPATSVANQAYRNKLQGMKFGVGKECADFAYWGGLASPIGYPVVRRMYRTGRWFVNGLATPETLPPGDRAFMKAMGTTGGDTFDATWKPLLVNAILTKGLAQIVFHQQISTDATQAAEFDKLVTWLDANRADIDVTTISVVAEGLAT